MSSTTSSRANSASGLTSHPFIVWLIKTVLRHAPALQAPVGRRRRFDINASFNPFRTARRLWVG